MHKAAANVSREERVKQSANNEESLNEFKTYIPNGNAAGKLERWRNQGAEIYYLTSRRLQPEIMDIFFVLNKYNFPDIHNLLFRKGDQEYKDVAEELMPDILIEDDCESIGGEKEMTYPNISLGVKDMIKSVVVKEFQGINHLSDDYLDL
jgi:hypothetical protein